MKQDKPIKLHMMLSVMLHAMEVLPDDASIVFLTHVSYIQQNFDKAPTEKSANADLIQACIAAKRRHTSVEIKTVPYHKYAQLPETHDMAHRAMLKLRDRK